jgi:capsular polysaccharide biosynthesis protein
MSRFQVIALVDWARAAYWRFKRGLAAALRHIPALSRGIPVGADASFSEYKKRSGDRTSRVWKLFSSEEHQITAPRVLGGVDAVVPEGTYNSGLLNLYKLTRGRFLAPGHLTLSNDDRVLYFYGYWALDQYQEFARSHWIFRRLRMPRLKRLKGRTLVVPSLANNYFHFLLEEAPRLIALGMAGFSFDDFDKIALFASSLPARQQFLEQLGIANGSSLLFLEEDEYIESDELYVFHPPGWELPIWAIELIRKRFPRGTLPKRNLYLTRIGATGGKILNEGQLLDILAPYGFEVSDPGQLDLAEQYHLFSEARIVIGPHGSAFANLAFVPPQCTVIEIRNPNYRPMANIYHMLSSLCGLDYNIFFCDRVSEAKRIRDQSMELSLARFKEFFDRVWIKVAN